ncbi:MAG: hypothetical protein HZB84_05010, partial [Deltaproteobacteria bacterium]|nr:hypothetical protein [Deltaproteobacteria bacterium]
MDNKKDSIILVTIIVLAGLGLFSRSIRNASATSGAFPNVKHGGGTTDGVTPYDAGNGPGVDRSVNPDYGSYYHN